MGGGGMACLKVDMYYHGVNSLLCVAPHGYPCPRAHIFFILTRND